MHRFAFSSLALAQRNESIGIWGLAFGLFCVTLGAPLIGVRAQPTNPSAAATKRTWQTHVVKAGESLGLIAARYRVRVAHLVEWNKIDNPDNIAVGRALRVFAPVEDAVSPERPRRSDSDRPNVNSPGSKGRANRAKDSLSKSQTPGSETERNGAASKPADSSKAARTGSSDQRVKALPNLNDTGGWTGQSKPRPNHPGTTNLRLHTIPTRPRSFAQRTFVFAMADLRGSFDAEQKRSWWQRRKDRRKARRARRFARKRERALAEQRAGQGSDHYEPSPSLANRQPEPSRRPAPPRSRTQNPAVPGKAQSVGLPNKGKLVRGIQLKSSNWYTVRTPEETWGSSNTINLLHHALVRFRENSKYKRELVVQDISKKGGGHFAPHRSHQSGRDVDIRLPVNRHVAPHGVPRKIKQVDWDAAWVLVHEIIKSGEVEYIFLNYDRQKHLYRAAKRAGVSKKKLAKWIQYPTHSKSQRSGLVRHSKGHSVHIHVRFRCGKQERRCRSK